MLWLTGYSGHVWCPCAEGQRQQRRVCVTEEWTAEESAPPSAESAEHTRVGRESQRGAALDLDAARSLRARVVQSGHRGGVGGGSDDAGGKFAEMGSAEDQEQANVSVQTGLAKARVQRHSGTLLLPPGLSFRRAESDGLLRAEGMKTCIPISFY